MDTPLPFPWVRSALAAALLGTCLAPGAWAQAQPAGATAASDVTTDVGLAGRRPPHIWSMDYVDLVVGDTGSVFTAPARWDFDDWMEAAGAVSLVAGTSAFDSTIRTHVQAGRTSGEDTFMKQWQEFGNYYAFGALAAFDAWGELDGDLKARNVAMDGIAASIIAGGLITPALKVVVGRERPSTTTSTFRFKPFSTNSSFPSGHATEAFAVAAAIAENYPTLWVECLAYGTAGLVGYARIEQNAHFASDVVAGSLIGWAVGRAVVHRNDGPADPKRLSWTPYATPNGVGVVFHKAF